VRKAVKDIHGVMNFDFCPWANKYVYWLKKPIGWVVLALLASLLLGIYVSSQAFLGTAAILAVGIIGSLWPWIAMKGIRGNLSWVRGRCEENESIKTTLTLENRWPWPAFGLFVEADHQIASLPSDPDQPISLSLVPGLARSQFEWDCVPGSRGIYPTRTVRLATAFPFGVWTCYRDLVVETPLIVWPRTTRLVDVPESQGTPNSGIGSTSNQIGDEGDWMGVRPYRPGDSLRQVHWAQTAKRDQLVVFERQSRARQQVSIWLDTGAAISSKDTADDLVRILASISNHFVNHSWTVRVHLNNNWQVLQPGKFGKQVWMDQLAEWTPEKSLGQSNNSAVVLPTAQKGGVTIILTTHDRLESLRSSVHPSDSISWIELLTDKSDETDLTPSVLTNHNSVLQVASGKYLSEQLDAQWKKYSQGLGRSSHVVSQVT
jgi:uncharacterized protein (DUF58 family)